MKKPNLVAVELLTWSKFATLKSKIQNPRTIEQVFMFFVLAPPLSTQAQSHLKSTCSARWCPHHWSRSAKADPWSAECRHSARKWWLQCGSSSKTSIRIIGSFKKHMVDFEELPTRIWPKHAHAPCFKISWTLQRKTQTNLRGDLCCSCNVSKV